MLNFSFVNNLYIKAYETLNSFVGKWLSNGLRPHLLWSQLAEEFAFNLAENVLSREGKRKLKYNDNNSNEMVISYIENG